jgi:hypothetical protein
MLGAAAACDSLLLDVEDASEEVDFDKSLVEDLERGIDRYSSRFCVVGAPANLEEGADGIVEEEEAAVTLSGRAIERLRLDNEAAELE